MPPVNETPTYTALVMDRGEPLGNSEDADLRRALHVKVKNKTTEPIPTFVVNPPTPPGQEVKNVYGEALAVASSSETVVASYTVPALFAAELYLVEVSGQNIAEFRVKKNGSVIRKKRTYWADFNASFVFAPGPLEGLKISAGDLIVISVIHTRPTSADFEAAILLSEYPA